MPTVAEQETAAIAEVKRRAQVTVAPVIADEDITAILSEYQLASIWENAHLYVVGEEILPTTRNGHRYRCIVGGTSGATEPTFPTDLGGRVAEGTGNPKLTWQEVGGDYDNVFDIRGLTYAILDLKVKRCAIAVDQKTPVGSLSASQMYEHWKKERDGYAPLGVY
jgi:hypothetical protein